MKKDNLLYLFFIIDIIFLVYLEEELEIIEQEMLTLSQLNIFFFI